MISKYTAKSVRPVTVSMCTSKDISQPSVGERFLADLCEVSPDMVPEVYGNYEPLRTPFVVSQTKQIAASAWVPEKSDFLWARRKPKQLGSVTFGEPRFPHEHSRISITTNHGLEPIWAQFIERQSEVLDCDYGFIFLQFEPRPLSQSDPEHALLLGTSTICLGKCLPDLPWLVVFGRPYVEMFGRDTLLAAPCPVVRPLSAERILLQLTSTVSDAYADRAAFEVVKQRVKEHLGLDAFFDATKGWNGVYRRPVFADPIEAGPTVRRRVWW